MTTLVQVPRVSSVANGATSNTITMTATLAGSSIVVACPVEYSVNSGMTIACSDDKGNSYAIAAQSGIETLHSSSQVTFFVCLTPTAGVVTITITVTGGTYRGNAVAFETPALGGVDRSGFALFSTVSSTYVATATAPDTGQGDFVVAVMTEAGANNPDGISSPATGGATWSIAFAQQNGAVTNASQGSYRFNASSTTNSATWTFTTPNAGACGVCSFLLGSRPLMGQASL